MNDKWCKYEDIKESNSAKWRVTPISEPGIKFNLNLALGKIHFIYILIFILNIQYIHFTIHNSISFLKAQDTKIIELESIILRSHVI